MASGSHWGNPDSTSPTHMSSYTKVAATWLRYTPASFDQDYVLTALENQRVGDAVLTVDDPLSSDPLCLYIIEARDSAVHFGAPECGVMIYHVTFNRAAGHPVVEIVSAGGDSGNTVGRRPPAQHPTLRGAGDPGGVTEYVNAPDGFRVRLLSESFSPYKATIRIERYGRDRVPGVAPYGAPSTSSVTTPRPH